MMNSTAFSDVFFSLEGRISRSDFWILVLATFIPGYVLGQIVYFAPFVLSLLMSAIGLAVFWVSLTAIVRRLHDMGYSGWLALLLLLPLVNLGLILFCAFMEGTKTANAYGPVPTQSVFAKF